MKLHLPLFIRKSVLACMLALSSIATTVVSGTMVAGSAMWAISNVAAEAQEEDQTVTITDNEDGRLTTTPAGSLIIMNLQGTSAGRWLIGPGTTHNVLADVQIDSLSITNGSSSATYNFTGDITGDGVFERTNNASASKQTYVFTGDMSQYSGNMNLAKENDGSTFCFVGNQSGTGNISIAAGNSIAVDGAVMNNSSITSAGTFTVSGNSFFAGDVTSTGTLNVLNKATFNHNVNVNGNLFLGSGALIINDGLFTFGDAVILDLSNVGYTINDQGHRVFSLFSSDSTGTSNFSSLTANNLSVIEKVGWDWSFNQNGTIVATRLGRDVSYAGGTLSWSTAADNKSFTQGSAAVSFEQGDNVTFAGDSQVTLAEDIQATRVIVGSEAEVAVHTAGHALAADIVEVEGALRYQLGGENSSILDLKGAGTLVLDNADADSAASFSIGGDVSAFTGGLTVQGNTTLALHGKANGLVSASEASVTIGDGAVLKVEKVENTAAWHTIWRLNDAQNLHTTGTGTIDVVDRGWLTEDVDIHKNFSCETSFILHGDGFYSNKRRNVFVGEGAGFYVDDTLTLMTYVALVVQGGTIDAGTLAVGNDQYWSKFFMSSGLLTAGSIKLSSHNGGTEVNISGGCVEFTQSQALNRAGNSAPYVRIVGSGPDSTVTLKATRTDWTLDGAGLNNKPVIGNITVDAGNTHGITLANVALTGSIVNNAELTLGEGISVAAGSSAVLSGATIAIDRTITNAGTLSLQTGSVSVSRENLQRLEISTEGATIAYSLDGKNFVTDGSENGFRHLTNGRYYLAAGGNLSVSQGLQAQVGESRYNVFTDATGVGFILPENVRSDVFVVNSGNVTVGAEAQAIAESYEINGGTMVLNAGSVAGESVHFNSASGALLIGGEGRITGTLVQNQGNVTVSGGHVNTLHVAGGSATLNGGSADTLLVGGSNGSVEVTGAFSTTSLRLSENGSATLTIKDGGNLTITGTNNTHSTNSSFMLGHWPYSSTLRQEGGELNARETIMYPSWDGNGTYQALGGVANLKGIYFWAHNGGAFAGSFLLGDETSGTARVNFGSFGIVDINSSVLVKLGNGTLGATADWGMTYNGGYAAAAVQLVGTTTGTIFNTEDAFAPGTGHIITINPVLTGNGKLVKEGIGSLYLKGANTYSGGTVIQGGELVTSQASSLGSGTVYLKDGSLALNADLSISSLDYSGGNLNANGYNLTITDSLTVRKQLIINGSQNGAFPLNGLKTLSFINSTADSLGGAIYGDAFSTITLSDNESVTFSGNTASSDGGAIYGDDGSTIALSDNESVTFSGNTASYGGGAIYGYESIITLSNNVSMKFTGNTAGDGGAIYGSVTMTDNGSVEFIGNSAGDGGAIMCPVTMTNNGSVTFIGNSAASDGAAIDGSVTMTGNGNVEFIGNSALDDGGAIEGSVTMTDNGCVVFRGNTAADGGAMQATDNLSICNNDSVLFEKNAEVSNGSYRLRSIHAWCYEDAISISSAAGRSIEFRDSVEIDSGFAVNLNADYTDADGETHKQQGDIIFTGKYTENHLNELLATAEPGRTATAEEILNSRTTEVNTLTNLYGGRLRVEEGAIYQGQGITAMEGSGATVRVQNAELSHVGYDLTFNAGTSLEVAGNSTIRGNVGLLADSLFKLEQAATLSLHETLQADAAELTVQGTALLAGSSTLNASLTLADGVTLDMMSLDAGAVTINGALTFGGKVEMGENLLAAVEGLTCWDPGMVLFTGLTDLTLPVAVVGLESSRVLANSVFSNVQSESLFVEYRVEDNVGSLLVLNVPEPATSTLSLLALAALVARRRRK